MHHQESMPVLSTIPALLLTVLQQVELVGCIVIVEHIGFGLVLQWFHGLHIGGLVDFHRLEPTAHPTLVSGVGTGGAGVIIVRARAHHVPMAHAEVVSAGVVMVHDAHAVGKLVAGSAYTVHLLAFGSAQLAAAGVGAYTCAVELEPLIGNGMLVRPDAVIGCSEVLAISGIDEEYLIYPAVAVPVVLGEIYLCIHGLACIPDHLVYIHILASVLVGAIISMRLPEGNGTNHIKLEVKLPIALAIEIVVYRTGHATLIVAHLVEEVIVGGLRIAYRHGEVGEVDQYDQSALLPLID